MVNDQAATTQVIAQTAVQVMAATAYGRSFVVRGEPMNMGPKLCGPTSKQPTFNWSSRDNCTELENFRLGVNNIFKTYNTNQTEKIPTIKHWPGREGL